MEVAERHEVTLKKPRQEAEVNPISELGVKVIDFQIDLEIQYSYYIDILKFQVKVC